MGAFHPPEPPLLIQDDVGLTAGSEGLLMSTDADALLAEARLALRDVLPPSVHDEHAWAAALVHCHATDERVRRILRLHADPSKTTDVNAEVRVHVDERYLSVAGVVGLLGDGAVRSGAMPLHTGRYVEVTLTEGGAALVTFWMPMVPVFRVSSRMVA
jgi:hypothetical protein